MEPATLLTLWLLPCAACDWRSRRVPNWLTLPALPLALWWAWGHGALALALAVFIAGYLAFLAGGMGGADGKIATVMAAVSPQALLLSAALLALAFAGHRLVTRRPLRLPAAVFMATGSLLWLLLRSLTSSF